MLEYLRALVLPMAASLVLAACGGGNAASQLVKPPDYNPKDQTKCGVEKSQSKPLIVEWPSPDRLELENKVSRGVVVVHYVGCEMTVLDRCSVAAKYNYQGATRNLDTVEMKDEDDLYAHLPVGAAGLEATLQRTGRLTVDMNLVGRFEAERVSVGADELVGECAGATHFVYGVTVGAFDFYAGGGASVGASAGIGNIGAGGRSQAERESLTKAGDEAACAKATSSDKAPPDNCGALIRIEVVQLGAAKALAPTCPDGTQWDGAKCAAAVDTTCAAGMHFQAGSGCIANGAPAAAADTTCTAGMRFQTGSGCVASGASAASDIDGDGIPDSADQCPRTPGRAPLGCPNGEELMALKILIRRGLWVVSLPGAVTFAPGSAALSPASQQVLGQVADVVAGDEGLLQRRFALVGHADNAEASPDALGMKRASAVLAFLVAHKVPASKLVAISAGAGDPSFGTTAQQSDSNRAGNRRAEFVVQHSP